MVLLKSWKRSSWRRAELCDVVAITRRDLPCACGTLADFRKKGDVAMAYRRRLL